MCTSSFHDPFSETLGPAGWQDKGIERNKLGKLKWLLHCTMGCQDTTFDTRKRELAILKGRASDADVLSSYISSVDSQSADPWMLEFCRFGHLPAKVWEKQHIILLQELVTFLLNNFIMILPSGLASGLLLLVPCSCTTQVSEVWEKLLRKTNTRSRINKGSASL